MPAHAHDVARQAGTVRNRPYAVLIVTTLGLFTVIVVGAAVVVALPAMSRHFGVSAATANWFVLAFMLGNASSILVCGRVSDLLGRRRVYLVGILAFVIVSVLIVFAPNAGILIALRALQGIAAATTVTNSAALVADAFPANRVGLALGLNLTASATANTLGPAVGGTLTTAFGWEYIFLIGVPFGFAALFLGARCLSESRGIRAAREPFDYAGAALSSLGLAALIFGVTQVSVSGWLNPIVIVSLTLGAAALAAFVIIESCVASPLVDLTLIKSAVRACAYSAAFFSSFSRAGALSLIALQLQIVSGRTPAEASLAIGAMALLTVIGAPISGRMSSSLRGAQYLSRIGALLTALGLTGFVFGWGADSLPAVVSWSALLGFGVGLFTPPNTTIIMSGVSTDRLSTANAVRSMLFNTAQALGTTVSLLILSAAGLHTYAEVVTDTHIVTGFQVGFAVLLLSALCSLTLSFARARTAPARFAEGRAG